jgi:uncharacterized cupredoxin-like copper-binding protein
MQRPDAARATTAVLFGAVVALGGIGASAPTPKAHVVNVIARDFALELPASIPAGLTVFQLKNLGKLGHHVTIVRLDSGHTAAEALREIMRIGRAPRPEWMHPVGGPQNAAPGKGSDAMVMLDPGNYLAFCEIPGPDTTAHYMRGMAKAFTVTGPAHRVGSAQGDDTLALSDFAFTWAHPLTSGVHTVAVVNRGTQSHMVVVVRLPAGVTLDDFIAWAKNPRGRPNPAIVSGGVTEMPVGATVVFGERFEPGNYGMVCFIPDRTDGRPHVAHGMRAVFAIQASTRR